MERKSGKIPHEIHATATAVERKAEHRRCVKHFSTQCMSWRCYQRGNVWGISPFFAPSFQPVTPEPELLYFRSLRPANVFERICTPWYKSAYIRVWTTPLLYRAVHISEFQCNFANDGCFWDLSFIHSLNLRSKAFRNSAWEQGDAIYPFLRCFFLALTGALCMACSGVTIFLGIYRVSQKKSVF